MGLFDYFFERRPNVEKLKENKDIKGLINALKYNKDEFYLHRKAVGALVDIGEPAVEPLIQTLDNIQTLDKRRHHCIVDVVEALGEIKDVRAIKAITKILDNIYFSSAEMALMKIGGNDAENVLIKHILKLKKRGSSNSIIEYFVNNENYKAAYVILRDIFTFPREKTWLQRTIGEKYFLDYNNIIIQAASYIEVDHTESGYGIEHHGSYEHDISQCIDAVHMLYEISSPMADNLLHEISKINDIDVRIAADQGILFKYGKLDFSSVRDAAKSALLRRGNPSYDQSIYLNNDAWKLK